MTRWNNKLKGKVFFKSFSIRSKVTQWKIAIPFRSNGNEDSLIDMFEDEERRKERKAVQEKRRFSFSNSLHETYITN